MNILIILISTFILLTSCNNQETISLTPITTLYDYQSYSVPPQSTDPNISKGLSTQFAFIPKETSVRKNKLFIFIPGTLATPQTYYRITQMAAEYGYHSFGIHYENNLSITGQCNSTTDVNCTENLLKEHFEGVDYSPLITVTQPNSIKNRITKMILFLDSQNPTQNWKQFLTTNNEIKWEMISLAGHSQGSGHTLYISKRENLFRASFFSGPNGFKLSTGIVPTWVTAQGATPVSKLFAFTNVNDDLATYNLVRETWQTLGLTNPITNIDNETNYSNKHLFTTAVIPPPTAGSASPTHGSTTVDIVTPLNTNGRPKFENIWRYMAFPE
jgi:hypothetical protein